MLSADCCSPYFFFPFAFFAGAGCGLALGLGSGALAGAAFAAWPVSAAFAAFPAAFPADLAGLEDGAAVATAAAAG